MGAGAGSYEPIDRLVVAVEPSRTMIAQRTAGLALRGIAEDLPFRNDSFDAALGVLTLHHWLDPFRGLAELGRVADRVVLFTFDPARQTDFWLVRDYLSEIVRFETQRHPPIEAICEALGGARSEVVPIPFDCSDGFQAAYWRRPESYLDPQVRASISTLAQISDEQLEPGLRRLAEDLSSGAWERRYAELLEREEMDFGYRLIVRESH